MLVDTGQIDSVTLQGLLIEREDRLRTMIKKRLTPDMQVLLSEDDALQEVWLVAFGKISTFLPDGPDSFDRWLSSVTVRTVINLVKCAQRMRRGGGTRMLREGWRPGSSCIALFKDIAADGRSPSREAFAGEAANFVKRALSELSPDRQRVVTLRYINGKSWEEIAEETGKSKPAIRSLAYQGVCEMRRQLGHSSHFFSDAASTDA